MALPECSCGLSDNLRAGNPMHKVLPKTAVMKHKATQSTNVAANDS